MNDTRLTVSTPANFISRYGLMTTVMVVIVYGSLYPFGYFSAGPFNGDIRHFVGTWNVPPDGRGDLLANLLLYMPVGLTSTLALGHSKLRDVAFIIAIGIGAGLSLAR